MKIKTITCHDVYNVGASLQAYALVSYLHNIGHEAEIIDYKPDYLSNHYPLIGVANSSYDKPILREFYQIIKLPSRLKARYSKRKKEYDYFTSVFLPCTKIRYSSYEELKYNLPEADVFIAGSDQIWNTLFKNGKDPAFYLDFVPEGCVRASYAASFATDDILNEWKEPIKEWLSKFDYISVREESGVNIIRNLGLAKVEQVLDPVFLLGSKEWKSIEKEVVSSKKYILIYDFDKNHIIRTVAKKIARENKYKIYSVLKCDYADRCFDQEGPQAFINLIHNAELIISNSFHATAFSIIFKKQFLVFNRNERINSRMQDLLNMFGLNKQLIKSYGEESNIPYIQYDMIEEKVNNYINKSKQYIDMVLAGGNL